MLKNWINSSIPWCTIHSFQPIFQILFMATQNIVFVYMCSHLMHYILWSVNMKAQINCTATSCTPTLYTQFEWFHSHGPTLYLPRFCRSKVLTLRAFWVAFSAVIEMHRGVHEIDVHFITSQHLYINLMHVYTYTYMHTCTLSHVHAHTLACMHTHS